MQLVPHLLWIWLSQVSRISLSPSHLFVSRKPQRFQFPNPLPSHCPLPRSSPVPFSFLPPLSWERKQPAAAGAPLAAGTSSRFPPPAQSLVQCLGRCVSSPSGEWIFSGSIWSFSSCLFCSAFVGTPLFPGPGTSARCVSGTSSLCPCAVESTWLWNLCSSWHCFLKHRSSASCTVCWQSVRAQGKRCVKCLKLLHCLIIKWWLQYSFQCETSRNSVLVKNDKHSQGLCSAVFHPGSCLLPFSQVRKMENLG